MRTNLKPFRNIRYTYVATFDRYGRRETGNSIFKTMLFLNVQNVFGDFVCDHIWINEAKKFNSLKLKKGDKVMFSAVVKTYKRGYYADDFHEDGTPITSDFRLSYIKNIRKIS